jgi:PIN domain nuclease of toxin-antitoxin system
MKLDTPLREWLQDIAVSTSLSIESITPAIAAATAELPDCLHRDPADRIILATARVLGATLITLDERLIESKLVATLC